MADAGGHDCAAGTPTARLVATTTLTGSDDGNAGSDDDSLTETTA